MKFSKRMIVLFFTVMLLGTALLLPAYAEKSDCIQGIAFVNTQSLRLRSDATTSGKVLDTAAKDEVVVVLEQVGQWYRVNYNLKEGYMHGSYLTVATKENAELGYGRVTATAVNLRQKPSTGSASLGTLASGTKCYILGVNEGWYKVIAQEKIGYVRSDYLLLTEVPYENKASSQSPKFFRLGKSTGLTPSAAALSGKASNPSAVGTATVSGSAIVAEAQKYIGAPYVAGGASPSGFDCSGYVYYVLKNLGLNPARTPSSQWATLGTAVSKEDLQPGDLVFFITASSGAVSHVGIYTGSGQFLHAPNSRSTVSYSDLTTGYWATHYCGARRLS